MVHLMVNTFFNNAEDKYEETNLVDQYPEIRNALEERIAEIKTVVR